MARVVRGASPAGRPQPRGGNTRRSFDRRPAAVHRHEYRRHLRAARGGARVLSATLDAARATRSAFCMCRPTRSTARWAHGWLVQRGDAVRAELAVRGEQGRRRSSGPRLLPHLRAAGAHHELLEQLRPVSISREADPADDPERARRPSAADLWRRRQCSRLAARRGSLRGDCCSCSQKGARGEVQHRRRQRAHEPARSSIGICDALDELRPAEANPGSGEPCRAIAP